MWASDVVVVLEVVLDPGDVVEGVEARGQLARRSSRSSIATASSRCSRAAAVRPSARLAEGQSRRGGGDQRRVAEARARSRAPPVPSRSSARDPSCRGRRPRARSAAPTPSAPAWSPRSSQAREQARVGRLVAPEPVLDRRAPGRQLDPAHVLVAGEQVDRLQQRRRGSARARRPSAAPKRARSGPRPGARDRRRGADAGPPSSQRIATAGALAVRARRRPRAGPRSPPSSPRSAACSTWWARSAAGAPLAARPAAARAWAASRRAAADRLVDGAADQRVAEDEAPRHLGRADQVDARAARRAPSSASAWPSSAISPATPGSNGSPATAAASSSRRAGAESVASSSASEAATPAGTAPLDASRPRSARRAGRARPAGRAARGRTGCRRRGGRSPPPRLRRPRRRAGWPHSASLSGPSSIRTASGAASAAVSARERCSA